MYPNLTPEQQYRVVEKIREFLSARSDAILSAA